MIVSVARIFIRAIVFRECAHLPLTARPLKSVPHLADGSRFLM